MPPSLPSAARRKFHFPFFSLSKVPKAALATGEPHVCTTLIEDQLAKASAACKSVQLCIPILWREEQPESCRQLSSTALWAIKNTSRPEMTGGADAKASTGVDLRRILEPDKLSAHKDGGSAARILWVSFQQPATERRSRAVRCDRNLASSSEKMVRSKEREPREDIAER